ncbi:MAG: PA-phosphatase [Bacteroidetes bacterium 43-93]|nr:inositol phosphorylceramide synthase [Bacteroidota bacterium]OJX01306.1 MAG: PA-phosphatase [Bacteroidetes bacterium 43-93]
MLAKLRAQTREENFFSVNSILVMLLISASYLVVSYLLIGFKTEQLFLLALINLFFFAGPVSRNFIKGFSIFIIYWVIFDYMKAFPNYEYNSVHIESLYNLEKSIFGFQSSGKLLTANEFWLLHHNSFLDVLTGIFYLTWVPVPLGFAVFLFFKNRKQFYYFSLTFLLVNLIGFVIYYIYPAAPPWYVQTYGMELLPHTPGNTAGLSRFDSLFGVHIFAGLYAHSSNVFAAMPSLHSSYPVIVLYYGLKNRLGWINILFSALMLGIWFSAVYNSHHYVIDVCAGILCAISGIILFNRLSNISVFSKPGEQN